MKPRIETVTITNEYDDEGVLVASNVRTLWSDGETQTGLGPSWLVHKQLWMFLPAKSADGPDSGEEER